MGPVTTWRADISKRFARALPAQYRSHIGSVPENSREIVSRREQPGYAEQSSARSRHKPLKLNRCYMSDNTRLGIIRDSE